MMCNTRLCSLKIALASFIERKSHSELSGINKHFKYFSITAHLMKCLSIIRSQKSPLTKEQTAPFEIGSTSKRKATKLTIIVNATPTFPVSLSLLLLLFSDGLSWRFLELESTANTERKQHVSALRCGYLHFHLTKKLPKKHENCTK